MGNWSEGFANVGCIRYVALGGNEDGADSAGVSRVAVFGVSAILAPGMLLVIAHSFTRYEESDRKLTFPRRESSIACPRYQGCSEYCEEAAWMEVGC